MNLKELEKNRKYFKKGLDNMKKKCYAELRQIKYYCSKCDKVLSLNKDSLEFDGWGEGLFISNHGGSSVEFTCKKCGEYYTITLSKY